MQSVRAGDPGVDLGAFRFQMEVTYGYGSGHVLEGREREAGMRASNVTYWDAVAALNTPAVLDDALTRLCRTRADGFSLFQLC